MIQFMVNEDRSALLPTNSASHKALAGPTPGEGVIIEFPEPYSHRELRKHVFATLGRVAKAIGTDAEKLRIVLLIRTGRCHLIEVPFIDADGTRKAESRPVVVVNSMARQFMDEAELRAFWKDMRASIMDFLPNLSEEERASIAPMLNDC
jgi:hypothetical protein